MSQDRSQHQGQREGHPDADAYARHGAGADLLPGEVRREGHHRGGNGPAALDHAPDDHAPDIVRQRRNDAADGEQDEPAEDHRLAPDAVREHTERDLKHRLGEPVGANGEPDQQRGGADHALSMQGEDRQDQEQAQHA